MQAARNCRYSHDVQTLVEDFLQYLRHERGQSDNTAKTYAALLGKFTDWAAKQNLTDWKSVELKHLMAFLQHERMRKASVGRPPAQATSAEGEDDAVTPSPQPSPLGGATENGRRHPHWLRERRRKLGKSI